MGITNLLKPSQRHSHLAGLRGQRTWITLTSVQWFSPLLNKRGTHILKQGTDSSTRMTPKGSSLLGKLLLGAFIIWYAPCRFCFACPEFGREKKTRFYFLIFFTSTPSSSSPQPGKQERSSVYMLKLHLFYSQLYQPCETNCSGRNVLEKCKHGTYMG